MNDLKPLTAFQQAYKNNLDKMTIARDYAEKERQRMNDLNPKSMREILFRGWDGCSNHGCIVTGPKSGTGTNGMCKCLVDATRSQLQMLQGRLSAVINAQDGHNE